MATTATRPAARKTTDAAGRRAKTKGEAPRAAAVEKDITPVMADYTAWLEEETGYTPDERTVQLAILLHRDFQKSDRNQARIAEAKERNEREAEEREQRRIEREERKVEREAAKAAKAAEPKEEKAPKAAAAKKAPAAKPAAKAAAKPAAAKPATTRRRATAKPATDGDF